MPAPRLLNLIRWLFSKVTDMEMCNTIMEDLEYRFVQAKKEKGKHFVYLRFLFQGLIILQPFLVENSLGGFFMLKNYFKTTVRNIKNFKMYSALNIIGLAVGLAALF